MVKWVCLDGYLGVKLRMIEGKFMSICRCGELVGCWMDELIYPPACNPIDTADDNGR